MGLKSRQPGAGPSAGRGGDGQVAEVPVRLRRRYVPRPGDQGIILGEDGQFTVMEVEAGHDAQWRRILVLDEGGGQPRWIVREEVEATGKGYRMAPKALPGAEGRKSPPSRRKVSAKRNPDAPPGVRPRGIPFGDRPAPHDEPVNTVQVAEEFAAWPKYEAYVLGLLLPAFRAAQFRLGEGEAWYAWIGAVDHHPGGLIIWLGLSRNVPTHVLDGLEAALRMIGMRTGRGTAIPGRDGLENLLYVGADGVELLRMV